MHGGDRGEYRCALSGVERRRADYAHPPPTRPRRQRVESACGSVPPVGPPPASMTFFLQRCGGMWGGGGSRGKGAGWLPRRQQGLPLAAVVCHGRAIARSLPASPGINMNSPEHGYAPRRTDSIYSEFEKGPTDMFENLDTDLMRFATMPHEILPRLELFDEFTRQTRSSNSKTAAHIGARFRSRVDSMKDPWRQASHPCAEIFWASRPAYVKVYRSHPRSLSIRWQGGPATTLQAQRKRRKQRFTS